MGVRLNHNKSKTAKKEKHHHDHEDDIEHISIASKLL